jgi:hypothetical protein
MKLWRKKQHAQDREVEPDKYEKMVFKTYQEVTDHY